MSWILCNSNLYKMWSQSDCWGNTRNGTLTKHTALRKMPTKQGKLKLGSPKPDRKRILQGLSFRWNYEAGHCVLWRRYKKYFAIQFLIWSHCSYVPQVCRTSSMKRWPKTKLSATCCWWLVVRSKCDQWPSYPAPYLQMSLKYSSTGSRCRIATSTSSCWEIAMSSSITYAKCEC